MTDPFIWDRCQNPLVTVELGEDLRVTVEVTRIGRPARLTGHPDRREPEEPPEWVVVGLEECNPYTGEWSTVDAPPESIAVDNDTITDAVREEMWQ